MAKFIWIFWILFLSTVDCFCQYKPDLEPQAFFHHIDSICKSHLGKSIKPFEVSLINGDKFNEKKLLGKVTVISFWFASCPPCIAEFSEFNKLSNKFKDSVKFQMLGLTFESPATIEKVVSEYKLSYPIGVTTSEECSEMSFNVGYPVIIMTNSLAKIIYISIGGKVTRDEIREQFQLEIIPKIEEALLITDWCTRLNQR